jgi:predicted membrane protein
VPIEEACIKGLAYTLWAFLILALLLEGIEFASLMYRSREGIDVIKEFVFGRLIVPFFVLQFGLGSLVPLLTLSFVIWRGTTGRALVAAVTTCGVLVMFAVLMMRYNVVIGGQEISKTGRGLLVYVPEVFGREGLVAAGCVLVAPFVLLLISLRVLSPWTEDAAA